MLRAINLVNSVSTYCVFCSVSFQNRWSIETVRQGSSLGNWHEIYSRIVSNWGFFQWKRNLWSLLAQQHYWT